MIKQKKKIDSNNISNKKIKLLKIRKISFGPIKPLSFYCIDTKIIEFGENQTKFLLEMLFAKNGKEIPNLYFKVAFRTTKKVFVIVSFRRLYKNENKPRRQSKS